MERKKNHIDQAFKESLKQFRAVPPEGVWDGITESLNADKRKARMAWMGRIAAAAVFVVAAGSLWLWVQRSSPNDIGKVETGENQLLEIQSPVENAPEVDDIQPFPQGTAKAPDIQSAGQVLLPAADNHSSDLEFRAADESQSPGGEASKIAENQSPGGLAHQEGFISGESRLSQAGTEFRIPVEEPGTGTLLATNGQGDQMNLQVDQMVSLPGEVSHEKPESGQGIDVFAEFGDKKSRDYNKWAVGGQVTPLYSYRNVESSSLMEASAIAPSYSVNSSTQGSYNEFESGIVSYAGGVNINYSPARRFSIQSGLYYSRMGLSITNSYVASLDGEKFYEPPVFSQQAQVANSTGQITQEGLKDNAIVSNLSFAGPSETDTRTDVGPVESPEIIEGDVLQQFEYLEIPLIARYRVVARRLGLNVLGGLSTNFLVGNSVYFQDEGSKEYVGTTEDIKPINYSSVLGVGLQYSISRKLLINMEPTFRYYLNSVNSSSSLGSHPYSLGFFTGISYLF